MKIAKEVTERIQKDHFASKGQTITTEIQPAGTWYDAEVSANGHVLYRRILTVKQEYHQKYLDQNPDGYQCPTHKLHW